MPGHRCFVSNELTEPILITSADQAIPNIMAQFVAKVTDQGSLGLVKLHSRFLAFHRVGFAQRDRDASGRMPGLHSREELGVSHFQVLASVGDFREPLNRVSVPSSRRTRTKHRYPNVGVNVLVANLFDGIVVAGGQQDATMH